MKYFQRGFIHISAAEWITACVMFGLIFGFVVYVAIPWLWRFFKPFIHSLTA